MRIVLLWIVGPLIVVAAAVIAVLRVFAQKIVGLAVSPPKVRVTAADAGRIAFTTDKYTSAEGDYSIGWDDAEFTKIGGIEGREARTVVRGVSLDSPLPPAGKKVEWSGTYFTGPSEVGAHQDVLIHTAEGPAPAWYFPGSASSTDWIIHVHGIRVTRRSPLRGVDAVRRTGAHSLVISYRGDTEGPAHPLGTSTLGVSEWSDIEPAIAYAKDRGAGRIFLMGWSMGGGMALLAAERASNRAAIDGLILIGPVTDWRATIIHGARAAGVPAAIGKLVISALSRELTARILGAGGRIDFDALDWLSTPRVAKPCLVLHSATDDEVPFELSERFAAANPSVMLSRQPDALHTLEWNRSRGSFEVAVCRWIEQGD